MVGGSFAGKLNSLKVEGQKSKAKVQPNYSRNQAKFLKHFDEFLP